METAENATDNASLMAPSEAITWCVFFSLEALVALATNAVTIIVFLQNTWLRKQTSILLLNLALADLLVSLLAIPGWVYFVSVGANLWKSTSTNLTMQILYSSLEIAGAFASVTNHGCIAVERLIATVMALTYRSLFFKPRRILFTGQTQCIYIALLILTLFISVLITIHIIQYPYRSRKKKITQCTVHKGGMDLRARHSCVDGIPCSSDPICLLSLFGCLSFLCYCWLLPHLFNPPVQSENGISRCLPRKRLPT